MDPVGKLVGNVSDSQIISLIKIQLSRYGIYHYRTAVMKPQLKFLVASKPRPDLLTSTRSTHIHQFTLATMEDLRVCVCEDQTA